MMHTRKDYLDGKCSHDDYYGEIVEECGVVISERTMEMVRRSTDPHFNDIALQHWDQLGETISCSRALRERGDYLTKAGAVCIVKQAAKRQLARERHGKHV